MWIKEENGSRDSGVTDFLISLSSTTRFFPRFVCSLLLFPTPCGMFSLPPLQFPYLFSRSKGIPKA